MTSGTESLIAAYEATRYRVCDPLHDFVLRIGEPSVGLLALYEMHGVRSAAYLTAYNPYSHVTPDEQNRAAQAALLGDLDSAGAVVLVAQGEGTIGDWPPEPSVLAIGLSRDEAEVLGRRYKQNAVVWIGADAVPQLVLLEPMK